MNYLGHLATAFPHLPLQAGGFATDHLRGPIPLLLKNYPAFPKSWTPGVTLHRQADSFLDGHPEVLSLKKKLERPLQRFYPIIMDITFDYLIIKHWNTYFQVPMQQFLQPFLNYARPHIHDLPIDTQRAFSYYILSENIWKYESQNYCLKSIHRVGERLSRPTPLLDLSASTYDYLVKATEVLFEIIFPQLMELKNNFLKT